MSRPICLWNCMCAPIDLAGAHDRRQLRDAFLNTPPERRYHVSAMWNICADPWVQGYEYKQYVNASRRNSSKVLGGGSIG
jgi:hypothetical protein